MTADRMVSNVEQWISFTDEALRDASAWHDTVDVIIMLVHPLVIGNGTLLFDSMSIKVPLRRVESKTYDNGVVNLRYERIWEKQTSNGGVEPPRGEAERSARTACYTPVNGWLPTRVALATRHALAELLGKPNNDALGAADVAEPIRVPVLHHFAD